MKILNTPPRFPKCFYDRGRVSFIDENDGWVMCSENTYMELLRLHGHISQEEFDNAFKDEEK